MQALDLKEGEDLELTVANARSLTAGKKPNNKELLARLRKFRGRLPADFKWDRLEANER